MNQGLAMVDLYKFNVYTSYKKQVDDPISGGRTDVQQDGQMARPAAWREFCRDIKKHNGTRWLINVYTVWQNSACLYNYKFILNIKTYESNFSVEIFSSFRILWFEFLDMLTSRRPFLHHLWKRRGSTWLQTCVQVDGTLNYENSSVQTVVCWRPHDQWTSYRKKDN